MDAPVSRLADEFLLPLKLEEIEAVATTYAHLREPTIRTEKMYGIARFDRLVAIILRISSERILWE